MATNHGVTNPPQQYFSSFFTPPGWQLAPVAAPGFSACPINSTQSRGCVAAPSAAQQPAACSLGQLLLQQLQLQLPIMPQQQPAWLAQAEQLQGDHTTRHPSSAIGQVGVTLSSYTHPQSGSGSPCSTRASYLPGADQPEAQFAAAGSGSSCISSLSGITPQGWQPAVQQQAWQQQPVAQQQQAWHQQPVAEQQHPLPTQWLQQWQQQQQQQHNQELEQVHYLASPHQAQVLLREHDSSSSVFSRSYGVASPLIPTPLALPHSRSNPGLSAYVTHCPPSPLPWPVGPSQRPHVIEVAAFALSEGEIAALSSSSSNSNSSSGDSMVALKLLPTTLALPKQGEVPQGQNTLAQRPQRRTLAQLRQQQQQFRQLYQQHLQQLRHSEQARGCALQQQVTTHRQQQQQQPTQMAGGCSASNTAVVAVQRRPATKSGRKRALEPPADTVRAAVQATPPALEAGSSYLQVPHKWRAPRGIPARLAQPVGFSSSGAHAPAVLPLAGGSMDAQQASAGLATMNEAELLQVAACMLSAPVCGSSRRSTAHGSAAGTAARPAGSSGAAAGGVFNSTGGFTTSHTSRKSSLAGVSQAISSMGEAAGLVGSIGMLPEQLQAFYLKPMTPAEAAAEAKAAAEAVLRAAKATALANVNCRSLAHHPADSGHWG